MRRAVLVALIASLVITSALPAQAAKADPLAALKRQVAALSQRVVELESASPQAGAAGRDGRDGLAGAAGAQGPKGEAGPVGATGPAGERGPAGATGAAGRDGLDGVGFPSGTLILVGGSCPSGFTLEGTEYGWRVYHGNPFTGTGSELWITACRSN